jgi:hypothetical protein
MTQVSMGLDGMIIKVMWDELLDYGRMEWQHMLQLIKRKLKEENNLLKVFDKVWGLHNFICAKGGKKVKWCYY